MVLLGPADSLCHGGLGHEMGRCDLPCCQATHCAQCQRDRRRRRQRRMRAQEVEVQRVVRGWCRAGGRFDLHGEFPPPPRRLGANRVEGAHAPTRAMPSGREADRRARLPVPESGPPARHPRPTRNLLRAGRGHRSPRARGPGEQMTVVILVTVGGSVRNGRTSNHS